MPVVHNKYHVTAPPGAVYIGRPSKWGNPFDVKTYGRDVALKMFRSWVYAPARAELRDQARRELKGKDLVCFCKPKACHGDLWLEIANTPMIATNETVEINHEQEEHPEGSRAARTN